MDKTDRDRAHQDNPLGVESSRTTLFIHRVTQPTPKVAQPNTKSETRFAFTPGAELGF
jgi:hypothetical protein